MEWGSQSAHPSVRWVCQRSPAMQLQHGVYTYASATGAHEANNSAGTSSRHNARASHMATRVR